MKNSIIEATDLTKKFGEKTAVDHVSFQVEEGELFGFLGPNGAGKTTTIRMLTTLASISQGRALVAGQDVAKNPGGVRANIGVVPQQLIADDELKGIENVLLFGKLHHVPGDRARKRAAELLQLVDLQRIGGEESKDLLRGNEAAPPAGDGIDPRTTHFISWMNPVWASTSRRGARCGSISEN